MSKEIKLEEGEIECPKCLGVGEILPKEEHFGTSVCPRCFGKGKLDWIEMVMGVPRLMGRFQQITIPLLRHYYPQLIAKDIVGVTSMEAPQIRTPHVKKGNKE